MVGNIDRDLKVKVLVLGDSGVGKSSFTHLISYGQITKNPGYTIGCSTEIKLHDFKQGTLDEKAFCVEVWDIGASKSHAGSRSIFYNNVNGVILVHDLTNNKSLQNLQKWLNDVLNHETSYGLNSVKVSASSHNNSPDEQDSSSSSLPLIMIGTKLELVNEQNRASKMTAGRNLATQLGCTEILLDTSNPKYLVAGSGNSVKLSRFFDKTIEHAMLQRKVSMTTSNNMVTSSQVGDRHRNPIIERKRMTSSSNKSTLGGAKHLD